LDYQKFSKRDKILLGCKGTTGTQASFLELFDGDAEKVKALDLLTAQEMGYEKTVPVSGQTYSRKLDSEIMDILRGVAESAAKFSSDIRLLQHLKEIEEPFEKNQIGSSAMAYKRNPMRSERIAALSRFVIANSLNAPLTAAAQWFERTLDDSANRRLAISEGFLAVDSILNIYLNVAAGLVVYPNVVRKRLDEEIPFMATENILMNAVKKGGDRQELHEKIRRLSMEAAEEIKLRGRPNDLLERLAADADFNLTREELKDILKPEKYIGLCETQVEEFLANLNAGDSALDNYELEF
jgi:adenylosuccinate lyase